MSATNDWGNESDSLRVSKRAKGRDRYNARRSRAAMFRLWQASKLLEEVGYLSKRGWQSELARRLGVHRSTICRDFSVFLESFRLGIAIEKVHEYRRLTARLDRRRRLGLPL